jgi:DNA-binding NarL/FixJ family response regulator
MTRHLAQGERMIRVASIDRYSLFQSGIIEGLRATSDISLVDTAALPEDIPQILARSHPTVLLIGTDGDDIKLKAISEEVATLKGVRCIIISDFLESSVVAGVMQSWAWGWIPRYSSAHVLVSAIRSVSRGERYVDSTFAGFLFSQANAISSTLDQFASLTCREKEILYLLTEGLSNKEIGARLILSEKTVKHYLTLVLDKLCVRNRVQAAIIGLHYKSYAKASPKL